VIQALLHSQARFQAFGASHVAVLAGSLVAAFALVAAGRATRGHPLHRALPRLLGLVIVVSEIAFCAYPVWLGRFSPVWGLPLQLCDMTALTFGTALMLEAPAGVEFGYFLGLSATLLTTFSPDLYHDFPHVEFWCFFLTHSLVAVVAAYVAFGLDRRPRPGAAWRVWLMVNGIGLAVAAFNVVMGSNYLYICRKPGVGSPFDYMGPWPLYVVVLDLTLAALLALLAFAGRHVPKK